MKSILPFILTNVFCNSKLNAPLLIKIEDKSKHIGDTVKIYPKIHGGKYYNRVQNSPTYLYVSNDALNNPLAVKITKKTERILKKVQK